jgi:hypothetical protein
MLEAAPIKGSVGNRMGSAGREVLQLGGGSVKRGWVVDCWNSHISRGMREVGHPMQKRPQAENNCKSNGGGQECPPYMRTGNVESFDMAVTNGMGQRA